jgi:hypothetical protein
MKNFQESAKKTFACIVCHKPLENAFENVANQPDNGLEFITHGHYGSTVFDPVGVYPHYLVVNICDECLAKAAKSGLVGAPRVSGRGLKRWRA